MEVIESRRPLLVIVLSAMDIIILLLAVPVVVVLTQTLVKRNLSFLSRWLKMGCMKKVKVTIHCKGVGA